VRARLPQHCGTTSGELLNSGLVLSHQVEQSAYLPRGLLRLAACLPGAQGSTGACSAGAVEPVPVRRYGRARGNYCAVIRYFQRGGAEAQDLVKTSRAEKAVKLRAACPSLLFRLRLGRLSKAQH
jgi:hypothetical protein